MNRSSRRVDAGLAAVCLALTAMVLAVPAGAAAVHFEKESLQAYEGQLHHGAVHAVTFHPGTSTGHLHISLNNGGHMTVTYASSQQTKLVAQARTANARVKIGNVTAKPKKAAPVKHKLRYIVGGVLIVVILVVLVVLLIGRRRVVAGEGRAPSGDGTAP